MTILPRVFPGDTVPTAGGWSLALEIAGKKNAHLFLPCGHHVALGKQHTINEVGEINPSVVCVGRHEGLGEHRQLCNFHDHVRLRSWTP